MAAIVVLEMDIFHRTVLLLPEFKPGRFSRRPLSLLAELNSPQLRSAGGSPTNPGIQRLPMFIPIINGSGMIQGATIPTTISTGHSNTVALPAGSDPPMSSGSGEETENALP